LPWQLSAVVDVTGRLSVEALMGFLGQTDLCIAASTGPLHLAAVLGTPVVGLFGGEAPVWPQRWKPIGPHVEVLVAAGEADDGGLDLRPEEIVAAAARISLSREGAGRAAQ
jgi:ADP-heptose:LPS heptosyltransferase